MQLCFAHFLKKMYNSYDDANLKKDFELIKTKGDFYQDFL